MAVQRDLTVFDRTADLYSQVRPGYPEELVEFVVERAGLASDSRLLELGCGPGLATEPFARRGFAIVAVDASQRMIENARRRVGANDRVTFVHSRFEDWPGEPDAFDLVYAGMAWHWLTPEGRDATVVRNLRHGGAVAILVNWPVTLWEEGQELYEAHWPDHEPTVRRTIEDRLAAARAELDSHGVLEVTDVGRWPWSVEHTADGYVDVLNTYSDHVALPPDVRRRFLDGVRERIAALGGSITRPFESVVMLARPVDGKR